MKSPSTFVGPLIALTLCLSSAMGQTVTATVTRQVTDPSGALVTGAKVTAEPRLELESTTALAPTVLRFAGIRLRPQRK